MYITHYYFKNTEPFRSLSSIDETEAIKIMKSLYDNESAFGSRFRDPLQYIQNRKNTEKWVRQQFQRKGCKPIDEFPIYFILGKSPWIENNLPKNKEGMKIVIPLGFLRNDEVSFTYPDSMISLAFSKNIPADVNDIGLFGKVFTKTEIEALIKEKGNPEEKWNTNIPQNLAPYIEAQVWNKEKIMLYIKN